MGSILFFIQKYDGVHNIAVGEFILHLEPARWQDIFQHRFQIILAENASLLGIGQNVLQTLQFGRQSQ